VDRCLNTPFRRARGGTRRAEARPPRSEPESTDSSRANRVRKYVIVYIGVGTVVLVLVIVLVVMLLRRG
jgi:hypothetical protein